MYWIRGNYWIEYDFYGEGEYSVQVDGDDVIFKTLEEAREFIDGLEGEKC